MQNYFLKVHNYNYFFRFSLHKAGCNKVRNMFPEKKKNNNGIAVVTSHFR